MGTDRSSRWRRAGDRWLSRRFPALRGRLRRWSRGERATEEDLFYAYRLILGREPDPEGWRHNLDRIREADFDVRRLALAFLTSDEFRRTGPVDPFSGEPPTGIDLEGFRLFVPKGDPVVGAEILRKGTYEPHVTAVLRERLRPGATFVDVGANLGYFTLLGATLVGSTGRVVAVEPNPENCRLILRSLRENGIEHVRLHPCAADEGSNLLLYRGSGTNGSVSDVGEEDRGLPVFATALDDLLREAPVDVIKIDVEGAEHRALAGARDVLRRCRPQIVTELSPDLLRVVSGVSAETFLQGLVDFGYELALILAGGDGAVRAFGSDVERIVREYHRSGGDHVDLLATPV